MIYLAAPYTDENPDVVSQRMAKFCIADSILLKEGKVTVSPLSKHFITLYANIPLRWEDWAEYSEILMKQCTELYVLKFDGWEESEGVAGEIVLANKYNIPVKYFALIGGSQTGTLTQTGTLIYD